MSKPDKFEKQIVSALKFQLSNRKITWDNIQEWSTSEDVVKKNIRPDETMHRLSSLGVYVALKV